MDAIGGRTRRGLSRDRSGSFRIWRQSCPAILPMTLADEIAQLEDQIDQAAGPIHLIGHSYGGAVAFKMATTWPYASRIRSLTLIEPVLPTLLCDNDADRRLHDGFADLGRNLYVDLWNGMSMEALDKFLLFWSGSGPRKAARRSPAAHDRAGRKGRVRFHRHPRRTGCGRRTPASVGRRSRGAPRRSSAERARLDHPRRAQANTCPAGRATRRSSSACSVVVTVIASHCTIR